MATGYYLSEQRENIIFVRQSQEDVETMVKNTQQVIALLDKDKELRQKILLNSKMRFFEKYLSLQLFGKFDFAMSTVDWSKVGRHLV